MRTMSKNEYFVLMSQSIINNGSCDDFKEEELIAMVEYFDERYFIIGDSPIDDHKYDMVRRMIEKIIPAHVLFTGVGSEERGGKIKLPYPMGSLNQVYEGEIVGWINRWSLRRTKIGTSDKLDGISVMIVYDKNGVFQIAYSRGNGFKGADISRHVRKLPTVPQTIENGPMVVRGEVIIAIDNFPKACELKKRAGKDYRNPRNMVAGLFNSSTIPAALYPLIDFIAYEIVEPTDMCKEDQLRTLLHTGFNVVYSEDLQGDVLCDDVLAAHLRTRRKRSRYQIDGLVLEVNSSKKRARMNPSRETLNPEYAIKYKIADSSNFATVRCIDVEYNVSKHGYLKPRVIIEPTELCDVTIQHLTGFNAQFIYDNKIGPGAMLKITRSGDVIPFILGVEKPANHWQEPEQEWEWNDTGVDAILLAHEIDDEVVIQQLISFFVSIDAPMLRDGNIRKLHAEGYNTPEDIISLAEDVLVDVLGQNGSKVFNGLEERLTDIPLFQLMGAHSTERGIGVRKMKKLQQAIGQDELYSCTSITIIADQEGFDIKTAERVIDVISTFQDFFEKVSDWVTIAEELDTSGGSLEGEHVTFTGFRDKNLSSLVEANGGIMQSGVSGKTTILVATNPDSTSGKMQKARNKGVRIMNVDEFRTFVGA